MIKVPCRVTLRGDKECASNFIGPAKSQLRILENEMSFQKLKQSVRRVWLNPRILVTALVCFGLSEVIIYCVPIPVKAVEKEVVVEGFYIRATFNGFPPVLCGERLKVENDNYSETDTRLGDDVYYYDDEGNKCYVFGWFSPAVKTGKENIFLWYWNNNAGRGIFSHFYEFTETTYTDEVIGAGDGVSAAPELSTLSHVPICTEAAKLPEVTTLDVDDAPMVVSVDMNGNCSGDCSTGKLNMLTGVWTTDITWTSVPKNGRDILITYTDKAEYDFAYSFPNLITGVPIEYRKGLAINPNKFPAADGILHTTRVKWLKHIDTLSECDKTREVINFDQEDGSVKTKSYDVYHVAFTDLYFLKLTMTTKLELDLENCSGPCGIVNVNEEVVTSGLNYLQNIAPYTNVWGSSDWTYACPGTANLYGCNEYGLCVQGVLSRPHVMPFVISPDQFCILSNEHGQDPTYNPITIDTNLYVSSYGRGCCDGWGGTMGCSLPQADHEGYREYKYEKELTPADVF